MKLLKNFIFEKFKINSKTVQHKKQRDDWSIETAEDGDIIKDWNNLYFIYKCLNDGKKYSHASENAIVYYIAAYGFGEERAKLIIGPDTGVGTSSDRPEKFKLATEEECEEFFNFLKEKGYKWDKYKKELVKL